MRYMRTCQSCGHKQTAKDPRTYKDSQGKELWRYTACQKCHSVDLDYGGEEPETPEEIAAAKAQFEAFANEEFCDE